MPNLSYNFYQSAWQFWFSYGHCCGAVFITTPLTPFSVPGASWVKRGLAGHVSEDA